MQVSMFIQLLSIQIQTTLLLDIGSLKWVNNTGYMSYFIYAVPTAIVITIFSGFQGFLEFKIVIGSMNLKRILKTYETLLNSSFNK